MKTINDSFNAVYLFCETDKNAIEYAIGETITFTVRLYGDGEIISAPFIEYELSSDMDKNARIHEYADAGSGCISVSFTADKPCFVKLNAYVCDSDKKRISIKYPLYAGACAGFDEIRQCKEEPEDFDSFWQSSLKLLPDISIVSGRVRIRELTEGIPDGYRSFEVMVPAVDDGSRPAVACMTYPENAAEGSLGLRCTFQGYGISSAAPTPVPGCITFAVSSHGIPVAMPEHYYNYDLLGITSFGFKHNETPETVYFRNMILRDIQMVRYAMTSPLWNGSSLVCAGGSMGAFQATAVAALMKEFVTELAVQINWMCDVGGEETRLPGWRPAFTNSLKYYDTINFAKRVNAPITIGCAGLGDYVSPPSGIASYFNEVKSRGLTSIKACFVQNRSHGGETHPASAEQLCYFKEHNI